MAELDPTIRRSITPATSEIIADILNLWEGDDASELKLGRTYIRGPQSLILDIGNEIEDTAWDAGDRAASNCFGSDNQVDMVRNSAIVNRLCMGRKLQGDNPTRKLVQKEVQSLFTQ